MADRSVTHQYNNNNIRYQTVKSCSEYTKTHHTCSHTRSLIIFLLKSTRLHVIHVNIRVFRKKTLKPTNKTWNVLYNVLYLYELSEALHAKLNHLSLWSIVFMFFFLKHNQLNADEIQNWSRPPVPASEPAPIMPSIHLGNEIRGSITGLLAPWRSDVIRSGLALIKPP